jgi:polyphosphate kinase 2
MGLKREEYDDHLRSMQEELNDFARWVKETGQRVLIIFEGRDTAGKGGAIRAVSERLNPRMCKVVALPAPSERERTQLYVQRYVPHLPSGGEIILFDRSWYNRAGVERVMGYCSKREVSRFLDLTPKVERAMVEDGIMLFKYYLTCDQKEQEKRFAERLEDPVKRWKLSPIDLDAREKYDEYTEAREDMLKATHTKYAPWTLVDFNDQRLGRLTLVRDLLDRTAGKRVSMPPGKLPPLKKKPSRERFDVLKPIPAYQA